LAARADPSPRAVKFFFYGSVFSDRIYRIFGGGAAFYIL